MISAVAYRTRSLQTGLFFRFIFLLSVFLLTSCHTTRKLNLDNKSEEELISHSKENKHGEIIKEATSWIGTPYKYAHQEKGKGTDCSGFVMVVYESVTGEKLPRNSAKQAEYCERIDHNKVKEGDLVFFATGKNPNVVSHVGIVIDRESFIHASSSKGVVISNLSNNYYKRTFKMFGRVPRIRNKSEK